MGAKDSFVLTWCKKHNNWWVTNCPDCMVDANEENIKKEGMREVARWIEAHHILGNRETANGSDWLSFLESKGLLDEVRYD